MRGKMWPRCACALLLVLGSGCSADEDPAWVGVWKVEGIGGGFSGPQCPECSTLTFLVLGDDDTLRAIRTLDCQWSSERVIEVEHYWDTTYEVTGETFWWWMGGSHRSSPMRLDHQGLNLPDFSDSPVWTRVSGGEAGIVRELLLRACPSPYTHCYGLKGTRSQCTLASDCLTPPSASAQPTTCQDSACLLSCAWEAW